MRNLERFAYFLIGTGFGVLAASIINEFELTRAVGEEEPYTPMDVEKEEQPDDVEPANDKYYTFGRGNKKDEFENKVLEIKERANDRRREFEERRGESKQKTSYSKMYEDGKEAIEDILNRLNMESEHPEDDEPAEESAEADDGYVLDRVEEGFEVYLGENPQDFISLVYYEGDETLCDDREQLISNPGEVVGLAAIGRLVERGPGAENGVVFVHNSKTGLNYEVVLDAGMYSETVLGIFEESVRRKGDGGDVDNR